MNWYLRYCGNVLKYGARSYSYNSKGRPTFTTYNLSTTKKYYLHNMCIRGVVRNIASTNCRLTMNHGYYLPFDRRYRDVRILAATSCFSLNPCRGLQLTCRLRDPSSKVEETVKTIKNKQKEKEEEIRKEIISGAPALSTKVASGVTPATVKKPLKTRIWNELVHYYHGFRLLFIDINVCRKLVWRLLNGKTLSRRENKLLIRTTSDLFRLIPFSIFIVVPFMELLLPLFIKFFPGMLPSTFQTAKEHEDKLRKSLQVKLEMAEFLQKTLDEMSVQHKEHSSEEAKQFDIFFQKVKNPNEHVSNEEIIKYAKRFEDEITLDSLSREQLMALCRLLELNTIGTTNFLRFNLRMKLRSLAADDREIARETVEALDLFELQQACRARGMRAYGLSVGQLRSQLKEWIELSLDEKVPPTLLLLSRALRISEDAPTTDKLKETMRVLPDVVAAQTKAAIGEREGKIDNKTKIEVIKEEERKIKEEREEEREERQAMEEVLVDKAPIIGEITAAPGDTMTTPPANVATTKSDDFAAPTMPADQPSVTDSISTQDVQLLSEALKTLSSDKNTMLVEKETIKGLKEELEDYKEDVQELHEVRSEVQEPVRESRAAKILFKKVNSMIDNLDKIFGDVEKQQHGQLKDSDQKPHEVERQHKAQDMVRVDELMNTIKQFKETSTESRLKTIETVLEKIDADKDGIITVDEVLKVVKAIGRENIQLNEKQLEDLINLLDKEEIIEAEERIEKAIAKSIKEANQIKEAMKQEEMARHDKEELHSVSKELKDNAKNLSEMEKAGSSPNVEELKDIAKELQDKAKNLDLSDSKVDPNITKRYVSGDGKDSVTRGVGDDSKNSGRSSGIGSIPTIPPPQTTKLTDSRKEKVI